MPFFTYSVSFVCCFFFFLKFLTINKYYAVGLPGGFPFTILFAGKNSRRLSWQFFSVAL